LTTAIEFFVLLLYILLIAIWLTVGHQSIRGELRDEATGKSDTREYAILPTCFTWTFYYLGLPFTRRLDEWRRARIVHEAAEVLAFTKYLSRHSYATPQWLKTLPLRLRIGELRGGTLLRFGS
jgi:hypothetical protein